MLQANLIGYLGSDAEVKTANGKEFVSFRVAHTDRWTSNDGITHESTLWVDCILNGSPNVKDYLKKGAMVFVSGNVTLRVYSSPKDKCMKAGMTINAAKLELIGGKRDEIPSRLFRTADGGMVEIGKYYGIVEMVMGKPSETDTPLMDEQGNQYIADKLGWITKVVETPVQQ